MRMNATFGDISVKCSGDGPLVFPGIMGPRPDPIALPLPWRIMLLSTPDRDIPISLSAASSKALA